MNKQSPNPRLKIFQKSFQIKNNQSLRNCYARADQKKLGAGGFGDIYRIFDIKSGEKNDIKCLKKVSQRDRNQAISEINALKTLSHPNILRFYEYFENESFLFIIIEYVKGADMIDYIQSGKQITEKKAATIMKQILEALAYTHDKKLVHRDIKCENIMISETQIPYIKKEKVEETENTESIQEEEDCQVNAKIIDWGFSYNMSLLNKEYIDSKQILGTYSYISPEQILKQKYDYKCDIWAAGIVLYCLLTKSFPFFSYLKFSDQFLHYQQETLSQFQQKLEDADTQNEELSKIPTQQESNKTESTGQQDNLNSESKNQNSINTTIQKQDKHVNQTPLKHSKQQLQKIFNEAKLKFEEEKQEDLFEQILKKCPYFDESILSEDAIDIIKKMLQKDQTKRPSAKELLQHPWFQNSYTTPIGGDKIKENLQKMKNFSYQNEFQMAVWMYISSHLVEDKEKNELQAMFKKLDIDNSGSLSKEELKLGFQEMELEINDTDLDSLFDQIDTDRNGLIDYNEFLASTLNQQHILQKTYLKKVFQLIDTDKNGSISLSELKNILGSPDQRVKEEFQSVFEDIFSQIDINKDGEISFEEFEKLISNHIQDQSQNQIIHQSNEEIID